ncbi:MAG: hypothetical protein COX07_07635 [Bacteroidetes bacterium CG23_combo_of_CG06-09_8_20_14_all_32_9]|nr:MAG: hypothetical protein COX07_07635 [Bacteroidetes bacterium CG23_combo_of_CG06-09_8_20_14_all_32_9]
MQTITITRKEYDTLLASRMKIDYLRQILTDDLFSPPPTKNINEITTAFYETGKYSKAFISSLKKGLKRSSYFKK